MKTKEIEHNGSLLTVYIGNNRKYMVKFICEHCGGDGYATLSRFDAGENRFCSKKCFQDSSKDNARYGRQYAWFFWDGARGCWYAKWKESKEKQKATTKARWLWEMNYGELKRNQVVTYIDGNPKNCELDNLKVISRSESNSIHLKGHSVSDEAKEKMSLAKKGKSLSDEHKKNIGKATERMWERGVFDNQRVVHPPKVYKTKEEISKSISDAGKKRFSNPEERKKSSIRMKGREFSDEHREKLSLSGKLRSDIRGENSKWWRGGTNGSPYPDEFDRYLKAKIRRRDGQCCQSCNRNVYRSKQGHVHHIDGNKQNCDEGNLILLCMTCHNAVHGLNHLTSDKIVELKSRLG